MLERTDFHTQTWDRLANWATSELERLRASNDLKTLTPEATAHLRGEIAFVKKFIGLPEFIESEAARDRAEPGGF